MKTLFLFSLLIMSVLIASSQTLKVTKVDATSDELYNDQAKRYLGKEMTLNIFDNSVTVSVGNMNENLRNISGGSTYSKIIKESPTETIRVNFEILKTINVVTSAIMTLVIQEKGGQRRVATATITAKRF